MRSALVSAICALVFLAASPVVRAADAPGRFTMSPAEGGGFVRLDTQTGAMALCKPDRSDWICKPMTGDDSAQRQEIERLTAENSTLKAEVRRLEELLLPADGKGTRPQGGVQLPTEQDVDKAFDYLQGLLKRFQDRMRQFEDKPKGTPL